jgi:hypothetical protein
MTTMIASDVLQRPADPTELDARIVAAFGEGAESVDVSRLLPEVESAANAADAAAGEARARALDPLLSRDEVKLARCEMEDAAFTRDRLYEAGRKLFERIEALKALEADRRLQAEHERVSAERDRLAEEMEGTADQIARIAHTVSRIALRDREIGRLNATSTLRFGYVRPVLSGAAPAVAALFQEGVVWDAFIAVAALQARTVGGPPRSNMDALKLDVRAWRATWRECQGRPKSGVCPVRRAYRRQRHRHVVNRSMSNGRDVALGEGTGLAMDRPRRGSHLSPLIFLMTSRNLLMERTFIAPAALVVTAAPALATMPLLGDMPSRRTDEACWAWADPQTKNEDVAFMWGILDDGNSDRAVAVRRLADDCLGKPKAEIVGFGSSAGFDRDYCRRHSRQKICLISPGR